MANLKELLSRTSIDKTDAKVLLTHLCQSLLNWPKTALISRDLESLPDNFLNTWFSIEQRRLQGEPVAYLIGKKGFYDIELEVGPDTLIPRPETEMLVDWAIEKIQAHIESISQSSNEHTDCYRILDLGTGSGAIALAIAHFIQSKASSQNPLPRFEIVGVDQSGGALIVAQKNSQALGLEQMVQFVESDWFSNIDPATKFNLIISNPPYISKDDPHLIQGDLRFEPRSALTDEADGLQAYRHILSEGFKFLKPNGFIAVEHGYDQGADLLNLFRHHGFSNTRTLQDLAGLDRITFGQFAELNATV